ncbi:hypothetical protein LTS10_002050 [Elasticomyces elasticus]|nr:hypothetical protein LTS10_002050 [Elasticomyces elasticus]
MANKGFFGSIMFLASVTIALLSMCCVGSAQDVALTRDEVLTSYLGRTGLHAVEAMRSGKYSRVSFVCGDKQWDLHNDYTRSPSAYFMSFLHKPSEELRIELTPYDCMIVPGLVSSFDSGSKNLTILTCPAVWHQALYRFALELSANHVALVAADRFYLELENSWQTPCFAYTTGLVYSPDHYLIPALREAVVDVTVQHYPALYDSNDDHSLFRLVGLAWPEFAADVAKARARSNSTQLSGGD